MKKNPLMVALLLAGFAGVAWGQKPEWKEHSYPDDGFSVTVPSQPEVEKDQVDTEGGKLDLHTYSVGVGSFFWGLAVTVTDLGRFGDQPPKDILQAGMNGSAAETKGKITAQKEISLHGAPGIEYELSTEKNRSRIRSYYVNGRTITVMSVTALDLPFYADTDRFFSSLRFIPEWKEYEFPSDGFAISAPSRPSFKSQAQNTAAGQVEQHLYSIDLSNDAGVIINVVDYGKDAKLSPSGLQDAKRAGAEVMKAKVSSEKAISLDSNPGLEFELSSESYRSRCRYYIVGNKFVAITSYAGQGMPLPAGSTRILDSLRLLKISE